MMHFEPTDSNDYRFPFAVISVSEIPAGFTTPEIAGEILTGLFLPRDRATWFGAPMPPRVLFLTAASLTILSHRDSRLAPLDIRLNAVCAIENGHSLLIGWIRLFHREASETLSYNTRSWRIVDRFMSSLRKALFRPAGVPVTPQAQFGPVLNMKFENALAMELDPGECVAASIFAPATEPPRRFGRVSRSSWSSGELVAITDRRALWISERVQGARARYGVVTRSASLASFDGISLDERERTMSVHLAVTDSWRIPLLEGSARAAREFAASAFRAVMTPGAC